jgi:Skp family chaperone for outer membrane proteins
MIGVLFSALFSQQKIGVVFSEKIRLDFEEFKEVEQQLQLDYEVIQKEYNAMAVELDSLVKDFEKQSLMMSEELKKSQRTRYY